MTIIDLSQLPLPDVVEPLDYSVILAEMLADLQQRHPDFDALVESDPAYKILEVAAYREVLLRQRVNEAAEACMLATATGADLDNLCAWYGVQRLTLTPANNNTVPPIEAVMESDSALRYRTQLSLERFTTAGATEAYRYHGLSADGQVKDISVQSPRYHISAGLIVFDDTANIATPLPNHVAVTVLSHGGSSVPSDAVMKSVSDALNDDSVHPLTDLLITRKAEIVRYTINATLHFYPGASSAEVFQAALKALHDFVTERHRLGGRVAISGIYEALHQVGVRYVELSQPAADIITGLHQAPFNERILLNGSEVIYKSQNQSGNTHNGQIYRDGQHVYH